MNNNRSTPEIAARLVESWLGLDPDHISIIEMLEESGQVRTEIAKFQQSQSDQE